MKLIRIADLFEVKYGVNLELINLEECNKEDENSINFVSRTDKDNGISAYVKRIVDVEPNPAYTLSVAGGGSVLATFFHKEKYYSGRDIYILIPKKKLSEIEMIFYCYSIRQNKYRYNYGRQANRTLKELLIPESMPEEWKGLKIENLNTLKKNPVINKNFDFDVNNWKEFEISELFNLQKCKCSSASELLEKGNDIYYVGAKKKLNGIMERVELVAELVTKGDCIVFIGDGQGSVGYSNFQPVDFIGSTTLTVGYNKYLNKFNALFITTVLDRERYRYHFGRKYGKDQLLKASIKLPVASNGNPDWEFMENYIKSLPYSSSL